LVVFIPEGYGDWILGPSTLGTVLSASRVLAELRQSADIIEIPLHTGRLTDADLQRLAAEAGIVSGNFVNLTEGLDVPAYVDVIKEVVLDLGRPPDVCVVPYGAGILCNEISDHLKSVGHGRVVPLSVAEPTSMARMLYGPIWLDTGVLARNGMALSVHQSPDRTGAVRKPYPVFLVQEREIIRGMQIAQEAGISAEPSGVVGLGILHRLRDLCPGVRPDEDIVVVINTGNGIDGFLNPRRQTDGTRL
jgi:hypothetical protein